MIQQLGTRKSELMHVYVLFPFIMDSKETGLETS